MKTTQIKLLSLIKEIIDLYKPEELKDKGIEYNIERDSITKFMVNLKYKNQYYTLTILPIFNQKRSAINFGSTDKNYKNLNLSQLLNSPYSSRMLASIFGLVRYWIDKYNIQEFEYNAEGEVRNKLYNYYLIKHFSDFKNSKENYGDKILQVWKKH